MTKTKLSAVIGVLASVGAASALAGEPAAVQLGSGIKFVPTVNLDLKYDDNVTSAERNANRIESWVTVLNPNFELQLEGDKSAYRVNYSVTQGDFENSDEDNFTDHELSAEAKYEFTARHRLNLSAYYLDGHEDRGTGFSQGGGIQLDEPDTFQETDINALYSFGAESAKGKLDFELGKLERDYEGGDATETRDRKTEYGTIRFRYNVGGRTELTAEATQRDITYDFTPATAFELDSKETDYLVGVTWEGTAKTTGTIKVGHRKKDFDSGFRKDFSGSRWEANVTWEPLTYSVFSLTTSRGSRETNGAGNFIDNENYTVSWKHAWADRLSSTLSHSYDDDVYEGSRREERTNSSTLRFDYELRRWLSVNAGFTYTDKESNAVNSSYDRSIVFVGIQASL